MKKVVLGLIEGYQKYVSPLSRPKCNFYPTCSEYTTEAVLKYGVIKGCFLGLKRIIRCHPWQQPRVDKLK